MTAGYLLSKKHNSERNCLKRSCYPAIIRRYFVLCAFADWLRQHMRVIEDVVTTCGDGRTDGRFHAQNANGVGSKTRIQA